MPLLLETQGYTVNGMAADLPIAYTGFVAVHKLGQARHTSLAAST